MKPGRTNLLTILRTWFVLIRSQPSIGNGFGAVNCLYGMQGVSGSNPLGSIRYSPSGSPYVSNSGCSASCLRLGGCSRLILWRVSIAENIVNFASTISRKFAMPCPTPFHDFPLQPEQSNCVDRLVIDLRYPISTWISNRSWWRRRDLAFSRASELERNEGK